MSYRKKHIQHSINKRIPKKPLFLKVWFWVAIGLVVLISTALYFLFFYPNFQIRTITISGNVNLVTEELEKASYDILNEPRWNVWGVKIYANNFLFVSPTIFTSKLPKQFTTIDHVVANKHFAQNINIVVTERKPIATYCQGDECFFIDASGIIFDQNASIVDNNITIVQTDTQKMYVSGDQAVAIDKIQAIQLIKDSLQDTFGVVMSRAIITKDRVDFDTNEGWKLYLMVNKDIDIVDQVTKLKLLLSDTITSEKRKQLVYIDLRFNDRAYYK